MCVIGNILGIPTAGTLVLLQFWLFILFSGIEGFSCVLCLGGSVFLNRSNKICRFLVEEVLLFAFCINGTQWRVFGISPGDLMRLLCLKTKLFFIYWSTNFDSPWFDKWGKKKHWIIVKLYFDDVLHRCVNCHECNIKVFTNLRIWKS